MDQQQERTFIFHKPIRLYVKSGIFKSPAVEMTQAGNLVVGFNYNCLWLLVALLLLMKLLFPIIFLRVLLLLALVGFGYYVKNYSLQLKPSN